MKSFETVTANLEKIISLTSQSEILFKEIETSINPTVALEMKRGLSDLMLSAQRYLRQPIKIDPDTQFEVTI